MQRARLVAGVALALMLCACATTGGRQHVGAPADDKLNDDVDSVKVASVNRWVIDHGGTVIWINYPQKRKSGDGS